MKAASNARVPLPPPLTSDAIDHEGVQLLFAMLAHAREVRGSLGVPVKQVVQQGESHLLCRATVGMDVQQVTEARTGKYTTSQFTYC